MFAAIKRAAPLAAIAAAAILAGCTVAPAPYYDDVYAYSGPSTVFVGPYYHHYGYYGHYGHYGHYGPAFHGGYGGGFHGRSGGGGVGGGHR